MNIVLRMFDFFAGVCGLGEEDLDDEALETLERPCSWLDLEESEKDTLCPVSSGMSAIFDSSRHSL